MFKFKRIITILMLFAIVTSSFVVASAQDEASFAEHDHDQCINHEVNATDEGTQTNNSAVILHTHTRGNFISSAWQVSPLFNIMEHCYYNVRIDTYQCATCGVPFTYDTGIINMSTHNKIWDYNSGGVVRGFHCSKCGYYSWK